MDEMKIREKAIHVYKMHKSLLQKLGEIIGYINLGDINNHLLELEQSMTKENDRGKPLAKSMLVLMVRGLFSKLQFAYAQFSCSTLSGHHLYPIFWEAVERLERCGFRVIACTCDGLSVNRRFFKFHGETTDTEVYKTPNPYSNDNHYIYFFSDPPHLIKTVRNCWASKKRLLWVCLFIIVNINFILLL